MDKVQDKFMIFKISDTLLATRVADIKEMIEYNHPKKIHTNLPDFFEGIFNLRGDIVSSINLKALLGLYRTENPAIQLIFGEDNNYIAAGIDNPESIEEICCNSLMKAADSFVDIPNEYYLGDYTYRNNMVGVLNLKGFLLDMVSCETVLNKGL